MTSYENFCARSGKNILDNFPTFAYRDYLNQYRDWGMDK